MMNSFRILTIIVFALTFGTPYSFAQYIPPSPNPIKFVHDLTYQLSLNQQQQLETKLQKFNDATSTQLVVVLVASSNPFSIEEYSHAWAEKWGIGQKGSDNGILLMIALHDHQSRIEVGYGLEDVITDVTAARILQQHLVPSFKKRAYFKGISDTVDALIQTSQGKSFDNAVTKKSNRLIYLIVLVLVLAGGSIIALVLYNSKYIQYRQLVKYVQRKLYNDQAWDELKMEYYSDSVDQIRQTLQNRFDQIPKGVKYQEQVTTFYNELVGVFNAGHISFKKRHDATLQKAKKALEKLMNNPIYTPSSISSLMNELEKELGHFEPLAESELDEANLERKKVVNLKFRAIFQKPESLLELDEHYLNEVITESLNKESNWSAHYRLFEEYSIKKIRDKFKKKHQEIHLIKDKETRLQSLFKFYQHKALKVHQQPHKFFHKKPNVVFTGIGGGGSTTYSGYGGYGSGGGFSGGGGGTSSGGGFGGGSFGGGGASAGW